MAQARRAAGARARSGALRRKVAHYRQTLGFTCGPSTLLMAMNAQDRGVRMTRPEELQLWREATSLYGGPKGRHGGCGPIGLALAAHRRGFQAAVQVNHRGVLLAQRTKKPEFVEVVGALQARDAAEARRLGIPIDYREYSVDDIAARLAAGWIPIVLITCWYIHGDHTPHWVVVTGIDGDTVTVNDPWVSLDKGKTARDMTDLAVSRDVFVKMTHYRRLKEQATVFVGPRRASASRA